MKPKAIPNLSMVRGTDGLLRLEMLDTGGEVVLDPLAELIWDLSDGSRSLEDLSQAAGRAFDRVVHKEEIFSALDFLADAGLLEERIAPPAAEGKVSRRSLLVRIAPVVGAAAWMASGASYAAGAVFQESAGKESNSKESNNKSENSERNSKESNDKVRNTQESNNKERDKEDRNKKQRDSEESDSKESDSKESRHEKSGYNQSDSNTINKEHNHKEHLWYDRLKGRIDHTGKYAVAPSHPLVGGWKHVTNYSTLLLTFSADGTQSTQLRSSSGNKELGLNNWKYTSNGSGTGILEIFQGELEERNKIRWLNSNEFELACIFKCGPGGKIGERARFVRDY